MPLHHNASAIYRRTLAAATAVTIGTLCVTALFTNILSPSPNGSFVSLLTVAGFACVSFSLVLFAGVDSLARHAIACEMQAMKGHPYAKDFIPAWMQQYMTHRQAA